MNLKPNKKRIFWVEMITNKWLMSHFEGNLRPVNKILSSGHEQAEDESEYKEDLGAMASPAYASPARRCRPSSRLHRADAGAASFW